MRSIFIIAAVVLYSCDRDEVSLVDESLLLGRWEPIAKRVVYKDGTEVFSDEHICEWYDTYTFFEDGRLRYTDGIKIGEDSCGNNPELEIEGEWEQDANGNFTFTITKTDGLQVMLRPKDLYFVQEEPFLVIQYFEEDPISEVLHYHTSFSKLE